MAGRPATLAIRITASTAAARAQLESFNRSLDGLDRSLGKAGRSMAKFTALGTAASGLGPLAAAAAAAGAAFGAFGAAAAGQLTKVTKATDLYAKAQEQAATDSKAAAETMKQYKAALNGMPASTRATTVALIDLKDAYGKWSDSLADTTMPLFTDAIKGLTAALPALTPLVKAAAQALKPLVDDFKKAAEDGSIERYTTQLAAFAGPSMANVVKSVENLAVGFANLFLAFGSGTAVSASEGLLTLTERFRTWSDTVEDSPGFQQFVDIANRMWEVILKLVPVALEFGAALLPLAGYMSEMALKGAEWLAALPPETIENIAKGVLALAAALKLAQGAQVLLNLAVSTNPYVAAAVAAAALAAGIYVLYTRSQKFREIAKPAVDAVSGAFNLLKDAVGKVTQAYQDNKSWLDPLFKLLAKVAGYIASYGILQWAALAFALSKVIDTVGDLIKDFKTLWDWLKKIDAKSAIKIALSITGVSTVLGALKDVWGFVSKLGGAVINIAANATVTKNTKSARALGARSFAVQPSTAAATPTRTLAAPTNLFITIDGQQLQARITRTVSVEMARDGARLQAGGWA